MSDRETAIAYLVSIGVEAQRSVMEEAITMLVERFADVREEARAEALEDAARMLDGVAARADAFDAYIAVSFAREHAARVRSLKPRSGT